VLSAYAAEVALRAVNRELEATDNDREAEALRVAHAGLTEALDVHRDAEDADPDMMTDEQIRQAVEEALYRVVPSTASTPSISPWTMARRFRPALCGSSSHG